MKKRLLSFILAVLLLFLLLAPFCAFALVSSDEDELSLLQEGDFEIETSNKVSYNAPSGSIIKTVEEHIYEELLNVSSSINITIYRISTDDVGALLANVINDNADLFYVSSSYRFSYLTGSNVVTSIIPYYAMSYNEIQQAKEIFNNGANKALSVVDNSMSDIQKALVIHDYICDLAAYPKDAEINDKEIYHSAYGLFCDGNVVCAGYTLAYSYLMHMLGIECEYVSSNDMAHAWNRVKIDSKWYNADLTYDDYNFYEGLNTYGSVHHNYFLKSDSYFEGESGLYHYDASTHDLCSAFSTDLDESFWDDVNSRIFVLDGDYYYLNPNFSSRRAYLTKRTPAGEENTIGSYFSSASLTYTNYAYDSSGALHQISNPELLVRLAYLDNRFYIIAGNSLYSQHLSGKRYNITSISYYPTGLSVRNNNIVYNIYADNSSYELDKLEFFKNNITTSKGGYNNYADINNDLYVNAKDYLYINNFS